MYAQLASAKLFWLLPRLRPTPRGGHSLSTSHFLLRSSALSFSIAIKGIAMFDFIVSELASRLSLSERAASDF